MSCILNISRFLIPNDVITTLTNIYKYIGRTPSYEETVGNDLSRIIDQTLERDCYFLSKILNLEISDSRLRLIITKHSEPRSKDESTLFYIKEILKSFQMSYSDLTTQSNDLNNLVNYIYPNQNIKFDFDHIDKKAYLRSQSMRSKRILLDEINDEVNKHIAKDNFETIVLSLHYFVDFYNLEPFTAHNDVVAYLLLYLLLLKASVLSYQYVSFFELLYSEFGAFEIELKNASFNWKEGFSQTNGFIRFMTKLILNSYIRTNEIINEYKFDANLNKSNNIENTISKLPAIFTKDEIRLIHPYVSESTINRTLSKLRDEKLIKPLGKGRSAKWIKIKA